MQAEIRAMSNMVPATMAAQRAASIRIACVLAGVALVFFTGIIVAQCASPSIAVTVALGVAVIGFPLAAIVGRIRP